LCVVSQAGTLGFEEWRNEKRKTRGEIEYQYG
jgi:hypothetical protein